EGPERQAGRNKCEPRKRVESLAVKPHEPCSHSGIQGAVQPEHVQPRHLNDVDLASIRRLGFVLESHAIATVEEADAENDHALRPIRRSFRFGNPGRNVGPAFDEFSISLTKYRSGQNQPIERTRPAQFFEPRPETRIRRIRPKSNDAQKYDESSPFHT